MVLNELLPREFVCAGHLLARKHEVGDDSGWVFWLLLQVFDSSIFAQTAVCLLWLASRIALGLACSTICCRITLKPY